MHKRCLQSVWSKRFLQIDRKALVSDATMSSVQRAFAQKLSKYVIAFWFAYILPMHSYTNKKKSPQIHVFFVDLAHVRHHININVSDLANVINSILYVFFRHHATDVRKNVANYHLNGLYILIVCVFVDSNQCKHKKCVTNKVPYLLLAKSESCSSNGSSSVVTRFVFNWSPLYSVQIIIKLLVWLNIKFMP